MKRFLFISAFFFTSFLHAQADAITEGRGHPYIRNYEPGEYPGHMQNWSVNRDLNGFIYVSNGNGVLEFDGENWCLITLEDLNAVRTVTVDKNNVKWVGADRELGFLEPDSLGGLQFHSLKDIIPEAYPLTASVWNVFTQGDAVVFRGGSTVYIWENERFRTVTGPGNIHTGFQVRDDILFRIYDQGLFQLKNNSLQLIPGGEIFKELRVYAALPYQNQTTLLGTRENGLYIYDGKSVTKFENEVDAYLVKHRLYNGLNMPDGTYAFATLTGGVIFMDGKGRFLYTLTKENGLLNDEVYGLCLDNRNNLWLSMQRGISYVELMKSYTFFDDKDGLEGSIDAVARYDGSLYVGTFHGLFEQAASDNRKPSPFKRIAALNAGCTALLSTEQSLIVLSDNGTYQISKQDTIRINNYKGVTVLRSLWDPNRVFLAHKEGLASLYLSEGQWNNETSIDNINEEAISLAETEDGTLWLGTRLDGVIKIEFDQGKFPLTPSHIEHYDNTHGLSDGWHKVFIVHGKLFVTSKIEKLPPVIRYDSGKNQFIPTSELDSVLNIKATGLYPLASQDNGNHLLLASFPHSGDSYRLSAYRDTSSPNYSVEILQDWRFKENNKVYWDGADFLWLGGEGLVSYSLGDESLNTEAPKAFIRKVFTAQNSLLFAGIRTTDVRHQFQYPNSGIRFEFATPVFENFNGNSYQYMLNGFDTDWSDWSHETGKEYTNLTEGTYRFLVRSKDVYGQVSGPDSFDFTVVPPWYRTWWAYLIYLLFFGSFLWAIIKWRSHRLRQQNEALERLIGVRTSEVQHQANQLKIQAEKLLELDKAKSTFFANISHEFRTPLTLIKGPVEQLEKNLDEKLSLETIRMIRRNANRLLQMVNQLLDLSKIDEGKLQLAPTEGDIYQCLRAAASSFNSHAAQRRMDYRVEIPTRVLWVSFDRDKLENIVYNLLGNSFKFSTDMAQITCTATYDDSVLHMLVSDTGKGIPAEQLPLIFDRFYQADNSNTREKGGTGIGLSLSKDLVQLMGGTIEVSSEEGAGTLFTVDLPMQEIRTRLPETVPEIHEPLDTGSKKPFTMVHSDSRLLPTVLLIEDNADMRTFIRSQLIAFFKVKEALNGVDGLRKAMEETPDLIITDLMMPKMDGIELCKKLKTEVLTSHIPVIMLTARAGKDNKLEGLETGADDYLTKPFDPKELLVRTRNLIDQRRQLRELFSNREMKVDPKKITVNSVDQNFLVQVLDLLETNFSQADFGVPQMQTELAMSKSQLHRKLKALTNEAPGEVLRNFRLKRAAQLLSQKADSVTQVAYKVGFNNLSYFAKCFRELYGISPSAYQG